VCSRTLCIALRPRHRFTGRGQTTAEQGSYSQFPGQLQWNGDKQDIDAPVKSLVFAVFLCAISCISCIRVRNWLPNRGHDHLSNEMVFLRNQKHLWQVLAPKHVGEGVAQLNI
jgi:hypothetical protein